MAKKTKIKGLKELISKLKTIDGKITKNIDAIIEGNAREMEGKAKQNAPVGISGALRQSGFTEKKADLVYSVGFNAPYAGYVEFGTGAKVSVPVELEDVANALRNASQKGSFKEGLQAIKDWCRVKGIPEEAAYPIFIKILNEGIRPRPFLYPAFKSQENQFFKDIEDYLQKELNKL